ncbi:MAG: SPOR domain-containing protein [Alphaproteobacteria bacterium]|nr:SPOR domain-containing protein [Alphaproteobacteria bacterium]
MLDNFPDSFRRDDDEEVLNEFRQKQVNFDLEERKNEIDNSRSLFVGALAGLIMAGVVGWFVLAPRYQSDEPQEVPIITRPQTVVKMQPSEPGDVELASQERTVYDIIEKKNTKTEESMIVNSSEEPDAKAIEKLAEDASLEIKSEESVESLTQNGTLREEEKMPEVKEVAKKEVAEIKKEEVKVQEVKQTAKADILAKTSSVSPKTPAQSGNWQIQLMSSPNKAAVDKSWATMSGKYPMLKDLPHEIESADLGAKGVFYRLKAGAFASKDEATSFCTKLKNAGGNCFTVKK